MICLCWCGIFIGLRVSFTINKFEDVLWDGVFRNDVHEDAFLIWLFFLLYFICLCEFIKWKWLLKFWLMVNKIDLCQWKPPFLLLFLYQKISRFYVLIFLQKRIISWTNLIVNNVLIACFCSNLEQP